MRRFALVILLPGHCLLSDVRSRNIRGLSFCCETFPVLEGRRRGRIRPLQAGSQNRGQTERFRYLWFVCERERGAMKKSIGDNMIPKGWSFERGLELVKKSGWDGIELWLGDVPWFQMETTDAQVTELRRKVENAGLVVSNVSTGLHWETPLSARDPNVRAKAIRIVERQIETSQLLGCDAVLVVAGGGGRGGGDTE